jgi:homoserine O-acetyltransferase
VTDASEAFVHDLPPASGAWRVGDPVGHRQFVDVFREEELPLEVGGVLGGAALPITVAYETWGELNAARDNAVLVLHALTGDSHVAGMRDGAHPTPGWWDPFIGPGRAIDTDKYFVLAPNVLGGCQGTTGPSSLASDGEPWGSRFPALTIRDQVRVEHALADELGIECFRAVVGGSMGGMRALEWGVMSPRRVKKLVLLATGPAATAEQVALCSIQAHALRLDPLFHDGDYYGAERGQGPWRGLGVARRMAQISYRTRDEFIERFGRDPQPGEDPMDGGRFSVEGYLDYQARKLAWRFDANTYLVLSRAMDLHDVGRGRGGIQKALDTVEAETLVIGFDSDRLYSIDEQRLLTIGIRGAERLVELPSFLGHDAFLLEVTALEPFISSFLG